MKQISDSQFETEVLKANGLVLVDFWAEWCGPCRMLGPVIDQLSEEISGAEFVKVDVDGAPALSAQYGIMSIPFVAVFKDGKMAAKSIGFMPEGEVRQFLDENL